MFEQVLPRLADLELDGDPEPLHSAFIWGPAPHAGALHRVDPLTVV